MKSIISVAVVLGLSFAVFAEESQGFYGWRVSAGANFYFGNDIRMHGRSSATAGGGYNAAKAALTPGPGKIVNYNGGATIEGDSACNVPGYDTWSFQIPEGNRGVRNTPSYGPDDTVLRDSFYLGSVPYVGETGTGGMVGDHSGDFDSPGVSIELSRELYRNEDHPYGLDLVVGLGWCRRNNAFKGSGPFVTVGGSGRAEAYYENPDWLASPYVTPIGGFYGQLGDGPFHPSMKYSDIHYYDVPDGSGPTTSTGSYTVRGDYEEWEIYALLRPWYEITDWWRLQGSIGVGVARSEFDMMSSIVQGDGTRIHLSEDANEWGVYGIAGLGTAFRWKHIDLSVDFLARFLQDDMDIDGRYMSGTIGKPDWLLRVAIGVEF